MAAIMLSTKYNDDMCREEKINQQNNNFVELIFKFFLTTNRTLTLKLKAVWNNNCINWQDDKFQSTLTSSTIYKTDWNF